MGRRCCCRCCGTAKCCSIALITGGLVTLIIGLAAQPVIMGLVNSIVAESMVLTGNSSQSWDVWVGNTDVPMYMIYNMYTIKNPYDFQYKGAKPELDILGPFTFREWRNKTVLGFNEDSTVVYYKYRRYFTAVEKRCEAGAGMYDLCTLDPNTIITTVNTPLIGVYSSLYNGSQPIVTGDLFDLLIDAVNRFSHNREEFLIMNVTMRDAVFGYNDTLLELVNELETIAMSKGVNLTLQSPTFSLQINDSSTAQEFVSAVFTGKNDTKLLGSFVAWQGNNGSIKTWEGCPAQDQQYNDYANLLRGTEAYMFQPNLHNGDEIHVFTEDLMRSGDLAHTSTVDFSGVQLFRFTLTPDTMLSAAHYEPNCAYSDFGPDGVLNMTAYVQAPVFASKPYFYQANETYRQLINFSGVPDATLHDSYLDVEPITGACFRVHQRLQVNTQVVHNENVTILKNITKAGAYVPLMWADETATAPQDMVDDFQSQIGLALQLAEGLRTGGVVAGALMLSLGLAMAIVRWKKLMDAERRADEDGDKPTERAPLLQSEDSAKLYA